MLPNASRWISSRWRSEDLQIKTAFWQLAEIREAEDKGKTAEDKATMKRARRKRGGIDHGLDVLLEGSTNPEARKLADVIASWVATIPSPSTQELEKQMMPVNLRRKGKKERGPRFGTSDMPQAPSGSGLPSTSPPVIQSLPPWAGGGTPEAESDEDVDMKRLGLDEQTVYETFYSVIASNQLMFE